ncbi:sodium:dicarboxylate symporter [Denitrobacterium detoxificans]|uniref:Na+/H+-dicarboxylate symporter n=1 Tax=Denitrobacterium detoxificans TaxID=79604 RepID=A0A172RZR4_9ACTN|nr:dicarboxylate/amino acid:cation symporter [Denitrobacterium detoxificans]ANE23227.1 sodium:dicarboxylate symporter [Denitrobacterium detoxificans]SEO36818.1 Na+/H+-dicarboxylate symporter [Denitrobacterium detoxificans]
MSKKPEQLSAVDTLEGKKAHRVGLTGQILIALALGIVCGIVFHYLIPDSPIKTDVFVNGIFYFVGQAFIRLMQMLVVPLVLCSIVCGAAAIGDVKTLGKVGIKTLLFYICTTALAISIALAVGTLIAPGLGVDTSAIQANASTSTVATTETSIMDTLLGIIPKNPFNAIAEGDMLPVIFFALFVGILLAVMGSKVENLHRLFEQGNELMMKMTEVVMKVAPLGVFCLLANTFAKLGFDMFVPMLKYMGGVIGALAIQCFVVYAVLFVVFTRLNPITFFKKFGRVMLFAFSTSSSNATIPLNIETLSERVGVKRRISSFTIPLGATINMDGTSIMQGVAVVFTAQLFGVNLGPAEIATVIATATLASIGTAGVPSVGLVTLSMVFNSVGLPLEGIAMIMGIDRILDMLRTAVNITGDAVVTTIVAKQAGEFDRAVFDDPEAGVAVGHLQDSYEEDEDF